MLVRPPMHERAVFFADVLGFSGMSRNPDARAALDALSVLARVVSSNDDVARLIRSDIWIERFGLSDSIFLVANEVDSACRAAAEIFFNLAYINIELDNPVMLRGAVAFGEARKTEALFEESAKSNLMGAAVVEAVELEKSGLKGPRLLVSERVTKILRRVRSVPSPVVPLNRAENGSVEILWPVADLNEAMIGEVYSAALDLYLKHGTDQKLGPHYAAYFGLIIKSLRWLVDRSPERGRKIWTATSLAQCASGIVDLLTEAKLWNHLSDFETLLDRFLAND